MASSFGSIAVETLLYRLATDPARGVPDTPVGSRIHKSPVPASFGYPFLTFAKRGAQDIGPVGRGLPTTASLLTYEVKGVDNQADTGRIEDAAAIMDQALDGNGFEVLAGGALYDISVTRTSELQVELPPEEDGTVYYHLGGIYDFYVCKLT